MRGLLKNRQSWQENLVEDLVGKAGDDEDLEDDSSATYSDASSDGPEEQAAPIDSANVTPRRTAAKSGAAGASKSTETADFSTTATTDEALDTLGPFCPLPLLIVQFSSGKSPPPGGKVVYIDGAFDLFHVGHVEILKAARDQGDFLLVGIHTDEEVTARRGPHLPIMGLHERALSVLACRYADEVIIGAPQIITEDLLNTFGIGLVVRGTMHEAPNREAASEELRYEVPRQTEGNYERAAVTIVDDECNFDTKDCGE
ncbi:hypothetical protein Ndes2437B_g04820 [Nannochloris sp. 'desiccata']